MVGDQVLINHRYTQINTDYYGGWGCGIK